MTAMSAAAAHWDEVYSSRPPETRGWFQQEPAVSLELIGRHAARPRSVIDVGAGESLLVDDLVAAGVGDITLLDLSSAALDAVRVRLGATGRGVDLVCADVLEWRPTRTWQVWHDRAAFHFLTESSERQAYVERASAAVEVGGFVVLATFAADGPGACSGLHTIGLDAQELAEEFGATFQLIDTHREIHRTPGGVDQPFTWVVLRRSVEGGPAA